MIILGIKNYVVNDINMCLFIMFLQATTVEGTRHTNYILGIHIHILWLLFFYYVTMLILCVHFSCRWCCYSKLLNVCYGCSFFLFSSLPLCSLSFSLRNKVFDLQTTTMKIHKKYIASYRLYDGTLKNRTAQATKARTAATRPNEIHIWFLRYFYVSS